MDQKIRGAIFMACALAAAPALAQQGGMSMRGPADQAFSAGMEHMQHDMAGAEMTGNPDRDFVAMMLPHHKGAVAMAKTELQYGKDPSLRKMARDIIASQEREIAEMQEWETAHPAK